MVLSLDCATRNSRNPYGHLVARIIAFALLYYSAFFEQEYSDDNAKQVHNKTLSSLLCTFLEIMREANYVLTVCQDRADKDI